MFEHFIELLKNKFLKICRQEVDRMQRVIKTVYTNLNDLKLAIDGTIVMSQYLRDSLDAMYDARIPERWQKVCGKVLIGVSRSLFDYF